MSSKNQLEKFFKIMEKPCFWLTFDHLLVVFAQREFLLKRCCYSGPSGFKCKTKRVDWQPNQRLYFPSLPACTNHSINLFNSSNHMWEYWLYTWFKSPMIYKALPIFDHTHPIINKVTFNFPKFVSAHFIDSFLRYSRF